MDWNKAMEVAVTAVGSGGASFVGAFLRFKQRLKDAETNANAALDAAIAGMNKHAELANELAAFKREMNSHLTGWRLEFDGFKDDNERDQRHREALEEARAEARQSRPDPVEAMRHELEQLRRQLDRMKERQNSYVRNETFTEHTRAQEKQWNEIQRTLGRLETIAKS